MTDITGKSLVAGAWVMPAGDEFQSFNPATQESFNSFRSSGADEVAAAVVFLAGDDAAAINGQAINVCGGRLIA